jgi:methyl-accepting chemotaxis protein
MSNDWMRGLSEQLAKMEAGINERFEQIDRRFEHNESMIAQLIHVVGETNRKVDDLIEQNKEILKKISRISSTQELHKQKIANLEDEVNHLKITTQV